MADPSLADEAERNEKKDLILERLTLWSKGFLKEDIVTEAQKRHVPASPISTPLDLVDDPQLIARGFLAEVDHPCFGHIRFPEGALATLTGTRLTPAPALGQHNAEILCELGYTDAQHKALVESGAM